MLCFHHNDADGRASGAIVKKYIDENFPDTVQKYVEVDYSQFDKDDILSQITEGETVYVVDFHFSPEITDEMHKIASRILVFDHHKTGAEITAQYPKEVECYCDPGSKFAGCELVWNYLFPTTKMPRAVELIADRDKWAWKCGEDTAYFNEGLKLCDHQPIDEIWEELLNNDILIRGALLLQVIEDGEVCVQYRDCICKEYRNFWGFEAELFGYKCYAMNLMFPGAKSEMFAEKMQEYDICLGFVFKNGTWKISLRSNGKVDVSEIAKKFPGGGGHENCAGAEGLKELPLNF
ncbi:hypothetical protein KA005_10570 [bacterium]|nr:hypothetical protein [bacterium]